MPLCPACSAPLDDPAGLPAGLSCSHCGFAATTATPEDDPDGLVGALIDGRYRVMARIGAGGMGVVYRVEHNRIGKVAALKVLRRELLHSATAVKRFEREAEAVSRLNHPHIVQTFDFGFHDGRPYLVMEYVHGEDLGTSVKRDGPMPLGSAWALVIQVCSALAEAHEQGIVHRDLKPDNILRVHRRQEAEFAKVLDFGLAKLRQPSSADMSLSGHLIGTPHYMSPEQVRSEPVDARSDLYSLGATLYRLVTGTPPFNAESPIGVLSRHITDPVEPPSLRHPAGDLPLELDHVVMKAMAKRPEDRFQSATEMAQAMEAAWPAIRAAAPTTVHEAVPLPNEFADELAEGAPLPAWVDNPQTAARTTRVTAHELPTREDGTAGRTRRLRREDVDAFERSLRRRRWLVWVLAPAGVLALAVGAWTLIKASRPPASQTETEPNDSPETANSLPQHPPLYGYIGEPHSDGQPDVDWVRIPGGQTPRTLTAGVSAIPDLNLVLELFDAAGTLVIKADGSGDGGSEQLGPVALGAGEYYLRTRPLWVAGLPTPGGSSTPYALDVVLTGPRPDWELEPNDDPTHANSVPPSGALHGFLSSADDEDWFVVTGAPSAPVHAAVSGVPAQLLLSPPDRGHPLKFDDETHAGVTARLNEQGRLVLAVKESSAHQGGTTQAPFDRQVPYQLAVTVDPAHQGPQ